MYLLQSSRKHDKMRIARLQGNWCCEYDAYSTSTEKLVL